MSAFCEWSHLPDTQLQAFSYPEAQWRFSWLMPTSIYNWIHWSLAKILHSRRESNHLTIHVVVTTVFTIFLIQDALGNLTTLDACSILCPSYPLTPVGDALTTWAPKTPPGALMWSQWSLAVRFIARRDSSFPEIFRDLHVSILGLDDTVGGRNPANDMVNIPWFTRFFIHPRWLLRVSSVNSISEASEYTAHYILTPKKNSLVDVTLQGTNISHLKKRKIIFKSPLKGDMLVPKTVLFVSKSGTPTKIVWTVDSNFETCSFARRLFFLP